MRFSFVHLFAFAISASNAQFTNQSAPFNLVVLSTNSTLNGTALAACHEGAAIEGLCRGGHISPGGVGYSEFQFNTSSLSVPFNASLGQPGVLTYLLRGGNFNESEAMALSFDVASNVALPLLSPSDSLATSVSFDEDDCMSILTYVDDRVVPVVSNPEAYYRWYICTTYYTGYTYSTLAWVLGEFPPQNPTCQKVLVKRVFI